MTDWIKAIQSKGRGFRPGMEITVLKSRQSGKSLVMDLESNFENWTHVMRTHYVEMYDEPGVLGWFRHNRKPSMSIMYEASKVIRHNEDGTYEYIKNRYNGVLGTVPEEEIMWIILKAR